MQQAAGCKPVPCRDTNNSKAPVEASPLGSPHVSNPDISINLSDMTFAWTRPVAPKWPPRAFEQGAFAMSDIEAQLKAVVYLSVSAMVEEELQRAGGNTTATPTYVASLVDLVYNQCLNLGEDLELFANHAGRVTINPSDMYMAVRKNPVLRDELQKFESELE